MHKKRSDNFRISIKSIPRYSKHICARFDTKYVYILRLEVLNISL